MLQYGTLRKLTGKKIQEINLLFADLSKVTICTQPKIIGVPAENRYKLKYY
jgi:hypothetical protein